MSSPNPKSVSPLAIYLDQSAYSAMLSSASDWQSTSLGKILFEARESGRGQVWAGPTNVIETIQAEDIGNDKRYIPIGTAPMQKHEDGRFGGVGAVSIGSFETEPLAFAADAVGSMGFRLGCAGLRTVLAAKNRNEESRGPVLVSGGGVLDRRRRVRVGGQNRWLSTRGRGVFEHACDRR